MYCLKCKKDTKDLNIKAFMTKNNRYMLKSTCNICKGKKSKFVSKKEIMGSGFLSNLFSKIPILNKILYYILMYYYRESTKDNYEDDIRNLNNKIDIVYTSLENIIQDRNDLLQLFNSRINDNIPNENIFHKNIDVDGDNRFKLIFTCKSKPSDIYKYIFHIFIKSDYNNINLKFIINNKDFEYDIVVDKLKYLKIEEKFIFNKVENFKIYLKNDKPLTIMKYSSYEVLINYHEATILNNQDHIKRLIYKTNKLYGEVKENNKLIREFILKIIKKDDLPIK